MRSCVVPSHLTPNINPVKEPKMDEIGSYNNSSYNHKTDCGFR